VAPSCWSGRLLFAAAEALDEFLFEHGGAFAEELLRELQHAAGVGDDLDGLNAGDVVEEPAAAGVHEHGVALELHEHERANAFLLVEFVKRVIAEEGVARFSGAIEHDADVAIARGVGILEEAGGSLMD
jgi:hypothetical protein